MKTREKLIAAFASALGVPGSPEVESYEYRGVPEWDSIAHLRLVAEIETNFDIMLETQDVINLASFAKGMDILSRHGVAVES